MMILAIWAVIVAALLVLLPMAVVEWWDLLERWGSRRRMREYRAEKKAEPGSSPPPHNPDRTLELIRLATMPHGPHKEGD